MPKEIDIRKIRQEPLAQKKTQAITSKAEHTAAVNGRVATQQETSSSQVTQSFISRFLDIMVCDVMQKLRLPLSEKQEDLVKKARDFEKFEDFCKKARGER